MAQAPVAWTLPARQDVLKAVQYLVRRSPSGAEKLLNRLEAAAASLAEFPEMGRIVPELGSPRRELLIEGYRLVYRVRAGEIEVLRVIHGKQDFLAAWKKGREL